ncbi:hypothetical protein CCAN11_360004 [Capnocytophaga canimorsus]|uniref:Uncharacterized protein n=1 Tax=Capnocytophaga canimorsus TaxID=28188 RepID=A0A0B7IQR3_9FLAO|nr:hypothetical protein [Capnocytophaga canimorsus]CEN52949.1 hypothetical protein CCAN11_360004 [Capnocytophaga canimorsus]
MQTNPYQDLSSMLINKTFTIEALKKYLSKQWNKAIFTLFPDGNFDMQFIWNQEWHDEIVRLF